MQGKKKKKCWILTLEDTGAAQPATPVLSVLVTWGLPPGWHLTSPPTWTTLAFCLQLHPIGPPPTVLVGCSLFLLCQSPLPNPSPLNSLSPVLPLISHKQQEKLCIPHLSPRHLKRDKAVCTDTQSSTKKITQHGTKSKKIWFHVTQLYVY